MANQAVSPLDILANQVMELEAEMRIDAERFQEAKRLKQERLALMRVKLEGMREMAAFALSVNASPVSAEPSQLLTPPHIMRTVILKAPYTWPHIPNSNSEPSGLPETQKRRRPLSDKWQPFFHFIETNNGATVEELDAFAVSCMKIEKKLAREQLRYYHKEQFVVLEVATKKYRLTNLGRLIYDPAKGDILNTSNAEGLDLRPKTTEKSANDVSDLV